MLKRSGERRLNEFLDLLYIPCTLYWSESINLPPIFLTTKCELVSFRETILRSNERTSAVSEAVAIQRDSKPSQLGIDDSLAPA